MMNFQSTRGHRGVTSQQAVLDGIAPDGGLYVPARMPVLPYGGWAQASFAQVAARILDIWLPGFDADNWMADAYAAFDTPEIAPLVSVGPRHVLELFHGPTLAFKDVALSVLPRLMKKAADELRPGQEHLVLIATSGDTGSAALHGFSGVAGIRALAFYPFQGISAVQRAQMVTMEGRNVRACGIRGDFDDAQRGVKAIFADGMPGNVRLTSANSINIGRLVPQITYYYTAYAALVWAKRIAAGDAVDFSVPTGNFGDILAGWLAKAMGLPVGKLICATNANDALHQFFETGFYNRRRPLVKTLSPSMDILVSSNLERLLWHASGGDSILVRALMTELASKGAYHIDEALRQRLSQDLVSISVDDHQALDTIRSVYKQHRYALDPHTAAAWAGAEALGQSDRPCVVLATASPFKFPQAMAMALDVPDIGDTVDAGDRLADWLGVPVPEALADLADRPERHSDVIDADFMAAYVRKAVNEPW